LYRFVEVGVDQARWEMKKVRQHQDFPKSFDEKYLTG
jgi:hypothetical protein